MTLPRVWPLRTDDRDWYAGFYTEAGDVIDTGNKYNVLVAPRTTLDPLSLTSVRSAMAAAAATAGKALHFSPGGPEEFDDRYPFVSGIQLTVGGDGKLAISFAFPREDWEETRESCENRLRRLFHSFSARHRLGPATVDVDDWDRADEVLLHFRVSTRNKTVGQAFAIGEEAEALFEAASGGPLNLERTVDLIRGGHAAALVDQAEGPWLDGKRAPYRLNEDAQKWELAKDVGAFANSATGGVIVLGARTEARRNGDILRALSPLPLALVKPQSYRAVLRARLHPAVEGLDIRVVDHGNERGVAYIYVPPQEDHRKPFALRGANVRGRINEAFVCIPTRDGEDTRFADLTEVLGLIQAGRAALRTTE